MKERALTLALIGSAVLALATPAALAGDSGESDKSTMQEYTDQARDAWLDGKLETVYALNTHLSALAIDTKVKDGVAHLSGQVESDIQRDLAGQLALGVDGIHDVRNDLEVAPEKAAAQMQRESEGPSFAQRVQDATTTAQVKSKLLANQNTEGLGIDVDTSQDVVTLSGEVSSAEEKQLAEQIARNTTSVKSVHNRLVVANR